MMRTETDSLVDVRNISIGMKVQKGGIQECRKYEEKLSIMIEQMINLFLIWKWIHRKYR